MIFVSPETQLQLNPRAASELEANARIVDILANDNSDLLKIVHPLFNHLGKYYHPVEILPSNSSAVAILFAKIITFFSGKNVVSQRAYMQ